MISYPPNKPTISYAYGHYSVFVWLSSYDHLARAICPFNASIRLFYIFCFFSWHYQKNMLSYLSVNRCELNAQEYFGFAEDTRQGEYTKHKFQKNTQEYFAVRRRYSLERVCKTQISKNTQEYRSGHNEAVLKTVCPKGTGVRIPLPAPKNTNFSVGVFLFFVLNLCAVTTGSESKNF